MSAPTDRDDARDNEHQESDLASYRQTVRKEIDAALSQDRWTRWRPWLDLPILVLFILTMSLLFAPPGDSSYKIPALDSRAPGHYSRRSGVPCRGSPRDRATSGRSAGQCRKSVRFRPGPLFRSRRAGPQGSREFKRCDCYGRGHGQRSTREVRRRSRRPGQLRRLSDHRKNGFAGRHRIGVDLFPESRPRPHGGHQAIDIADDGGGASARPLPG